MNRVLKRLIESFTAKRRSGYASSEPLAAYETPNLPLADVMKLYERDPACKASVDLLAASAVGMGFYTTVNENYGRAEDAKRLIDQFNEEVNLDTLLWEMARVLVACGNDFWLKISPERLSSLQRLPVDAIEKIEFSYFLEGELKIPNRVEGYKLRLAYGGEVLNPEAVIHWRFTPHPDICTTCTRFMETNPSDEYEIEGLDERISRLEPTVKLLKSSAQRRVRADQNGCVHMGQDGYCTLWYYYERRWNRNQKEDVILDRNLMRRRVYRDNVKTNPEICASCPDYSPRGKA
ncbi:MAG: hypothetical protein QHH12_07975 [Candidatus Bathyarchaeota archaeon]|jgi:hypothetical protein|nr:hypothetical protein [Candidatus Bathyarchaeota archaeon A05DMB-3]MDH7607673.1 hypothetical protein [Candidatus Bathyarchaeota archaeon]